jgi:hypothetical protein
MLPGRARPPGTGRFSTGLRHGDALHISSFDPSLPGLQVYGIHESAGNTAKYMTPGVALYDTNNGKILWKDLINVDVRRSSDLRNACAPRGGRCFRNQAISEQPPNFLRSEEQPEQLHCGFEDEPLTLSF